jgi:hypothetical protein
VMNSRRPMPIIGLPPTRHGAAAGRRRWTGLDSIHPLPAR